ncbi:hypothetical protein Nepgr_033579 [Nepenthes gracilis]|uniref:Uncharacterized protein n=1 Tax=Nepenthes gracilis TaxID=150966 RepID=A0AAD3TLF6_NEPGR|nr:hypothetical protein Nepgr_033579 [Nepenthes gracilis]
MSSRREKREEERRETGTRHGRDRPRPAPAPPARSESTARRDKTPKRRALANTPKRLLSVARQATMHMRQQDAPGPIPAAPSPSPKKSHSGLLNWTSIRPKLSIHRLHLVHRICDAFFAGSMRMAFNIHPRDCSVRMDLDNHHSLAGLSSCGQLLWSLDVHSCLTKADGAIKPWRLAAGYILLLAVWILPGTGTPVGSSPDRLHQATGGNLHPNRNRQGRPDRRIRGK